MTDQNANEDASRQTDDEISLLDLLATLTENLRLLVLGPLVVGLLALGVTYVMTPTYESRSVLRLGEGTSALLASDDLLSKLLPVADWLPNSPSRTAQLNSLSAHIKPTFSKKDGTFILTVTGPTPEQALKLHQATIEQLRQFLLPQGKSLADIQSRLDIARATLNELNEVIPPLSKKVVQASPDSEASSRAYSLLLQQRLATMQTIQELTSQLLPFGAETMAQAPSLPDKPVKPKKALTAIIATLAAGFALLVFVFIRQAVRNAADHPEDAARLAAIRRNLAQSLGMQR
jgi:uncharacterized protein involved in exopolysaccharide biosynthesis